MTPEDMIERTKRAAARIAELVSEDSAIQEACNGDTRLLASAMGDALAVGFCLMLPRESYRGPEPIENVYRRMFHTWGEQAVASLQRLDKLLAGDPEMVAKAAALGLFPGDCQPKLNLEDSEAVDPIAAIIRKMKEELSHDPDVGPAH